MADFYLLAVIRQTDPAEFVVLVSTVTHEGEALVEIGERVVARGDRGVDVVDD